MVIHGARVSLLIGLSARLSPFLLVSLLGHWLDLQRLCGRNPNARDQFFQVLPTLLFSMVIVALLVPAPR